MHCVNFPEHRFCNTCFSFSTRSAPYSPAQLKVYDGSMFTFRKEKAEHALRKAQAEIYHTYVCLHEHGNHCDTSQMSTDELAASRAQCGSKNSKMRGEKKGRVSVGSQIVCCHTTRQRTRRGRPTKRRHSDAPVNWVRSKTERRRNATRANNEHAMRKRVQECHAQAETSKFASARCTTSSPALLQIRKIRRAK